MEYFSKEMGAGNDKADEKSVCFLLSLYVGNRKQCQLWNTTAWKIILYTPTHKQLPGLLLNFKNTHVSFKWAPLSYFPFSKCGILYGSKFGELLVMESSSNIHNPGDKH